MAPLGWRTSLARTLLSMAFMTGWRKFTSSCSFLTRQRDDVLLLNILFRNIGESSCVSSEMRPLPRLGRSETPSPSSLRACSMASHSRRSKIQGGINHIPTLIRSSWTAGRNGLINEIVSALLTKKRVNERGRKQPTKRGSE